MTLMIYTTPTCPWCAKTKEFLKSKKIPYRELDVTTNLKARNDMIHKSNQMGVPVLDIDGKIIVGYDPEAILKALPRPAKPRHKALRKARAPKTPKKAPAGKAPRH